MYKSKLIKFLSAFKPDEINQLELFILSPLFNSGKRPLKVQDLFHYLLPFYPEFNVEDVKATDVYKAVFPKEPFNKNKLGKLASESVAIIRKFITVCCSDNQTEYNDWLAQLQFFRQRELDTDFLYAVDMARKLAQKTSFKEQEYFLKLFTLEKELITYLSKFNDKKGDVNLPIAIRYLESYYIISKMEFSSFLLTRGISTNLDVQHSWVLLEEVMKTAKKHYMDVPVIAVYYHTISLMLRLSEEGNKDGIKEFQLLKKVLSQHADSISKDTLRSIHSYMRNYLADRYNNGDQASLAELFELLTDQSKQKTIYQDGQNIWASTLQNAVTVALKLKETDWAMDFLKQHENRIKGADDSKAMYQFNLANIFFHQGKYQEAQDCLEQFHFREMFYNLAVRRLEMKLNYETTLPLEVFEFRLKALKNFVYEQKKLLPTDKYDSNNNFVKLLMQLFTFLKEDADTYTSKNKKGNRSTRIQSLIDKVENEKTIAEREWLLEKLNALLSENQN